MFTPWSHAVALIYQQLTKAKSLNGVCDAARVHASQWQELRGAVPPRRNTFSNANQRRDPAMMESLYWAMKDYLGGLCPEFVRIRNPSVLARFRKRHIHLLDSSTIQLVLNSIDWARHRARKAAAKLHMNYMLGNLLPSFAKWKLSFSRLAGVVRAAVWVRRNVVRLLETYGTARGCELDVPKPKPLYLQGFLPFTMSPVGRHPAGI